MASVPTIEVCKEDGSCRRRINEPQFGEYEQRGYRHLNRADPPSGDTPAEFPVSSGSPEDETVGGPSAFTD